MKFTDLILIAVILLIANINWAQECPNNLVINPGFENTQPDPSDARKVIPLSGWSNLNTGLATVDYFVENEALQSNWIPQPASGNYLALWISNHYNANYLTDYQSRRREGAINKLSSSIIPNTGSYSISFDYCCLNTCRNDGGNQGEDMPKIAIYGINNPNNQSPATITGSHSPPNMGLFPGLSISLLATTTLNSECGNELYVVNNPSLQLRGTKYQFQETFNMNSINHEITHILITHSDDVIQDAMVYIGIDDVCIYSLEIPTISNCCQCCKDLEKENQELLAQLNKCCERNPKCCKDPYPKPNIRPNPKPNSGVILIQKPPINTIENQPKCCICCDRLKKENADLYNQIEKCCSRKSLPQESNNSKKN
ncbi:MAG: hypothetical protein H6567_02645 [Lewinellaceae bacterium]|nr:hypothetical protein [Lewinellaceae bacterium]